MSFFEGVSQEEAVAYANLAKRLSHNDVSVRNKAYKSLRSFLIGKETMSHVNMMKVWKAIFYCFWMSDKELVQQEFARYVASTLQSLSPDMAVLFFGASMATLGREWCGIDKHRMDKYFMLVRRLLESMFQYCRDRKWDSDLIDAFNKQISTNVLSNAGMKGRGLALHVLEVFIDSLCEVLSPSTETLNSLSREYQSATSTGTKPSAAAAMQHLLDQLKDRYPDAINPRAARVVPLSALWQWMELGIEAMTLVNFDTPMMDIVRSSFFGALVSVGGLSVSHKEWMKKRKRDLARLTGTVVEEESEDDEEEEEEEDEDDNEEEEEEEEEKGKSRRENRGLKKFQRKPKPVFNKGIYFQMITQAEHVYSPYNKRLLLEPSVIPYVGELAQRISAVAIDTSRQMDAKTRKMLFGVRERFVGLHDKLTAAGMYKRQPQASGAAVEKKGGERGSVLGMKRRADEITESNKGGKNKELSLSAFNKITIGTKEQGEKIESKSAKVDDAKGKKTVGKKDKSPFITAEELEAMSAMDYKGTALDDKNDDDDDDVDDDDMKVMMQGLEGDDDDVEEDDIMGDEDDEMMMMYGEEDEDGDMLDEDEDLEDYLYYRALHGGELEEDEDEDGMMEEDEDLEGLMGLDEDDDDDDDDDALEMGSDDDVFADAPSNSEEGEEEEEVEVPAKKMKLNGGNHNNTKGSNKGTKDNQMVKITKQSEATVSKKKDNNSQKQSEKQTDKGQTAVTTKSFAKQIAQDKLSQQQIRQSIIPSQQQTNQRHKVLLYHTNKLTMGKDRKVMSKSRVKKVKGRNPLFRQRHPSQSLLPCQQTR